MLAENELPEVSATASLELDTATHSVMTKRIVDPERILDCVV
jgi:hypothetical protein